MSLLSELKERKTAGTSTNGQSVMENVALSVTAYDNNEFLGVNIASGEEIRIRLRDFNNSGSSRFSRPEIQDFMNKSSNSYTEIGGSILFDGCYVDKDGVYSARWAQTISPKKGQAFVVIGKARLSSGTSEHGKNWMKVDFAKVEKTTKTDNVKSFNEAVTLGLTPVTSHSSPYVVVRLTDALSGQKEAVYINAGKFKDTNGYNATMSGPDSYANFVEAHEYSDLILKAVSDKGTIVEVVPSSTIFGGPATITNYFKDLVNKQRLENQYRVEDVDQNGEQIQFSGYTDSIVVMRMHGDGTPFVTHIKPVSSRPVAVSTAEILPNVVEPCDVVEENINPSASQETNSADIEQLNSDLESIF